MKQREYEQWIGIVVVAWLIPIILFWIVLRVEPMLFFIITYTWYPLLAGVTSYMVAIKQKLGIWKWGSWLAFGMLNAIVFYVTYGITNTLSMSKVSWNDMGNFSLNAVCALIGFVIGIIARHNRMKNID